VIAQCTSTITATVGATTGTATLTVNPASVGNDTSIIINPNPTNSIVVGVTGGCPNPAGTTNCYQAKGNVTSQSYSGNWGSSDPTIASVNPTTGTQTLVSCLKVGTVNITVTVSGFSNYTPSTLNCVSPGTGNVIPLSDCSQTALNTAWGKMIAGANILQFPSCAVGGTGKWSSAALSLSVPANVTSVTLQGNTTVSCTGTPGNSNYTCAATDNTIIQDDVTDQTDHMINFSTGSSSTSFRMTGITFEGSTSLSSSFIKYNGLIRFFGSSTAFRMDHCHITIAGYTFTQGVMLQVDGQIEGVFDHNVFDLGNSSGFTNGVRVFNDLFDSGGSGADGAFQAATQFGSQHFIFMEANQITGSYTNDCAIGGRMVERYNTMLNVQDTMQSHPTKDSAGYQRGCRALEFYHNYVNTTSTFAIIGGEGGTWMIWGNTVVTTTASWFWAGANYRSSSVANGAPATNCNGISGANCLPPNGWAQCGTDMNYPGTPGTASAWDGNSSTVTGYPCLDNLGRGQQVDAMNNATFPSRINNRTGTQAWPRQYLEPIYLWGNTLPTGLQTNIILNQDFTTVVNRDIFGDKGASFTGATGTGCGPSTTTDCPAPVARPGTCTAGAGGTYATSPTGSFGVAYWDTGAKTLYICYATNTWGDSAHAGTTYTPYIYPHPLNTGP
jgi:hypothetical protein